MSTSDLNVRQCDLDIVLANANTMDMASGRRAVMQPLLLELVVEGVDLSSDADAESIGMHFAEWSWSSVNGQVVVSVECSDDPIREAKNVASALHQVLPCARVVRWHEDFVGYSEIAQRSGVSREAARLWATAMRGPQDFPPAHVHLRSGDRYSPIWPWARVAAWLADNDIFEDDYRYPSEQQVAEINWTLAQSFHTESVK